MRKWTEKPANPRGLMAQIPKSSNPIVKRDTSSVFQDTLSLDTAKHQVHLDEEIEKIRPGDTYVIDIANIPEQEKCLVFGDVIRSVYRMKTEGSADCPDRIILFVMSSTNMLRKMLKVSDYQRFA